MIGNYMVVSAKQAIDEYMEDLLKKHKIEKIGQGMFSPVFQHPTMPNVVVKLISNFTSGTDGGYLWLRWCTKHQRNPYVPKILATKKLNVKREHDMDWYAVFMEKLTKADPDVVAEQFIDANAYDTVLRQRGTSWTFNREVVDKPGAFKVVTDPAMREVLKAIYDMGAAVDMKASNFMMRGQQVVFTDPMW